MDDMPPSSAASSAHAPSAHGHDHAHDHDHGHEHHELGFWRSYVFSTDHKVIGIQYMFGGLLFMFIGFCLMLLMRWQLAFPGQALTWANAILHIGYQWHEILYHLGLGHMPDIPVPVQPDPNHPPLLQ